MQEGVDHLGLALELPSNRAKSKYLRLDNRIALIDVFNHLYYLYDEESQEKLIKEPNSQPFIKLVFLKKYNFEEAFG